MLSPGRSHNRTQNANVLATKDKQVAASGATATELRDVGEVVTQGVVGVRAVGADNVFL